MFKRTWSCLWIRFPYSQFKRFPGNGTGKAEIPEISREIPEIPPPRKILCDIPGFPVPGIPLPLQTLLLRKRAVRAQDGRVPLQDRDCLEATYLGEDPRGQAEDGVPASLPRDSIRWRGREDGGGEAGPGQVLDPEVLGVVGQELGVGHDRDAGEGGVQQAVEY